MSHGNYGLRDRPTLIAPRVVSLYSRVAGESEETHVERINQFAFYEFGKILKQLASADGAQPAHLLVWPLLEAQGSMGRLLKGDPIPLGVSRAKAQELQDNLGAMVDRHYFKGENGEFKFPDASDQIERWEVEYLKTLIANFETVFREEMREAATYYVPRRGIFSTAALVDSADDSFPNSVIQSVPEKARTEWRAAGRCLAFNLLSASGFHVARAVEATMETYYQAYSGESGKKLNSWNDYVKALEDLRAKEKIDPPPTEKTIAELRQMKDDYRNPIMHPRVSLSEADARMLFANGESLIIAMAQEIALAKEKQVQPSLGLVGGGEASA